MYGKPFNEKRDYGTVHGEARWHYEQDGMLYNALKQPVDQFGKLLPMKPPTAKDAAADTPAMPAVAEDPDDDIPEDEREFDILAWAQGDEALQATSFAKVKAEAARILEDQTGLVSKAAVKKAILEHFNIASE